MSSNTLERHEQLIRWLGQNGLVSASRAIQLTGASPATVRRDFAELTRQGLAKRVHGGIRLVESVGMKPFAMRQAQFSREKMALAQRAVSLLKSGDVVFIDGGTTTFHLGACLPPVPLRIITNSLQLAEALDERSRKHGELEIFLTGGLLYPGSGLLAGPAAHNSVAQYHADWAFLSVGGITVEGLFNTTELVVETERRMIANAGKTVVLADHGKIGRHAMCHVCGLDEIDFLITDQSDSSGAELRKLETAGLQIITVKTSDA